MRGAPELADVHRGDAELYRALEPALGGDATVMLLDRLSPPNEERATRADLRDLATKADLHQLRADLQRELRIQAGFIVGTLTALGSIVGGLIAAFG